MTSKELKKEIISAGRRAVEELIKVAKEDIVGHDLDDDISADKMKNAAAAKKLAIFDAFEILARIDLEEDNLNQEVKGSTNEKKPSGGFAEQRANRG
jgi:hypothetical protein